MLSLLSFIGLGIFVVLTIVSAVVVFLMLKQSTEKKYFKYKCPCCGFYTQSSPAGTGHGVCPVCYWEDDRVQLEDPSFAGGANSVSLIQAKENFITFGASEEKYRNKVRKPLPDELKGLD